MEAAEILGSGFSGDAKRAGKPVQPVYSVGPYQKLRQKIRNDRERTAEILQDIFADPLFEELVTYGKASDSTALKIALAVMKTKKCYLQSGFRKDDLSGKNKTARVVFQGKIRKIGRRFGENAI